MNLINYFENYSTEVPYVFIKRKDSLIKKINFYDCGLANYKKYDELLKILIGDGVHNPDYKIILDAHDFAADNFAYLLLMKKIIKCNYML